MDRNVGRCLCGKVTVSIGKDTVDTPRNNKIVCHCKHCRKSGGTFASTDSLAPDSSVEIHEQPKCYEDKSSDSESLVFPYFCANCGNPIYFVAASLPNTFVVKRGLFDGIPKPYAEAYCASRPSWVKAIDGAQQFDRMPTE